MRLRLTLFWYKPPSFSYVNLVENLNLAEEEHDLHNKTGRTVSKAKRLQFVWKTGKFRGELKWMEQLIPVEIFRKKVIPFEVLPFPRFYDLPKRPKFSVPFLWITSARLHVQRERKIYLYFVNGSTQSCSCFRCQKKYQYHLTEIFHRNFRTNGKRSRSTPASFSPVTVKWAMGRGGKVALLFSI